MSSSESQSSIPWVLLFDLDGTLIVFKLRVKESRRALIETLRGLDFDVSSLSDEMPTQLIYDEVKRQIESGSVDADFNRVRRILGNILDDFELEAFSQAQLTPSIIDVLNRFKSRGYRMGLVTNDGRRAATQVLETHSLGKFFEIVVTRDDVERMKPSPEGIQKALKALDALPGKAIYVGDSALDIRAAREAGVLAISLVGGVHSNERLLTAHPDLIVSAPTDLIGALETIEGEA